MTRILTAWRLAVLFGLAAVAVTVTGYAMPAHAHDHRVPKTVLVKGQQQLQTGYLVNEYSWAYPSGDGMCANEQAFLESRFPAARNVAADSKLRVRIFKIQRPGSFEIAAYRAVDNNGIPTGKGQLLPRTLKPVVRDGRTIAWDAIFYVTRPSRHYYLVDEGHWKNRQGCRADQFAHWSLDVKTRAL
jgi:hypothetical protein